jgi:tetratricopeptide (TPR) repeat protein
MEISTRDARAGGGLAMAGRWLFVATLAGTALAIGGVHTETLCVSASALAIAGALVWWPAGPMNARPAATLLLVTGVALTAFTILQCLPMPLSWLRAIAPHSADVWSRALAPLREDAAVRAGTISVDPVATRIEVLKGVAYILAFATAARIARSREGTEFLTMALVASSVVLAVAALLHPAFGAKRVFGFYEATGFNPRHIAPLLNANHLAAYVNVGFCLALASVFSTNPKMPRPLMAAVAVLLLGTQIWIASRGGVLAIVLGGVVVVALVQADVTGPRRSVQWSTVVSGAAVLGGVAMLVFGGEDPAREELLDTDVSKLRTFGYTLRMLPAYGWLGAGRGAFESAYPQFRGGSGHFTWTHPENVLAQWITEWGVPVGFAGLLAIAVALRPGSAFARSKAAVGALAALVAATVQNLVDFNSEIPGVMLAFVTCAAVVTGGVAGRPATWRLEAWAKRPRVAAVVGLIAAVCAVGAVLPDLGRDLQEDRRALHDTALGQGTSLRDVHRLARATMLRHPAEPYLPFAVGLRAAHARDESPLPWLGATLERAALYGPAHAVLARVLAGRSPAQARLEYRLALEQAPELEEVLAGEVGRMVNGYEDALEVLPQAPAGERLLGSLFVSLAERLPATSARLGADLARRNPAALAPRVRAATDAIADVTAGSAAPWCDGAARAGCVRAALELAERVRAVAPTKCVGVSLHARAVLASGNTRGGLDELERGTDEVFDRVTCLEDLVVAANEAADSTRLDGALEKVARAPCEGDAECIDNLLFVAQWDERRGNPLRALAAYKLASERAPDNDAVTIAMARVASSAGLHAEAAEYYRRIARRHPGEPEWVRAADAQVQILTRNALSP